MTPVCMGEVIIIIILMYVAMWFTIIKMKLVTAVGMESDLQYRIRNHICHGYLILFRLAPNYSQGAKVATRRCLAASNYSSRGT